ncbi:MAG: glycosyltransferase family protein [Bacteroidota bacterium]
MARTVFIVQGEGRGHLSQSAALKEYLENAGHTVEAVFTGCNNRHSLPTYYRTLFGDRLQCFASPFFLRTPNKKGIYVGLTILFNLFRSPLYVREAGRIRREITRLNPHVVFNFYDVVGALALQKGSPSVKRIGIGHHFLLHLEGYRCPGGNTLHKWFLRLHTLTVMRSCDKVLALSFRELPGNEQITVVPPLVRERFRNATRKEGPATLIYLLNEGFASDITTIAKNNPDFQADIFSELPTETPMPPSIRLHAINDQAFLEKMESCRNLVTTAGFDTVAEAAYMGVPLGVVPVRNHFEQRCNSFDIERSGLGISLDGFSAEGLRGIKKSDKLWFRLWVDRAGEMIINQMEE